MKLDLSLYVLIDPDQTFGFDPVALARAAASGGATVIQLRDKGGAIRRTIALAAALKAALAPMGVPLLVNDRVDIAAAAGADGVHLGQDDIEPALARRLLGPRAIIGQTVKSAAHVAAVPLGAVDYVAVGGVFATLSKTNPDPPLGLGGLAARIAELRARKAALPIAAIAGIDAANAGSVIAAGADGVALISAIAKASDPAAAAAAVRRAVDRARETAP
ncbi:thiamine phosphate synthase [Blastochloris viridis]|uniref:Thiamine-phosphate synthase n=1 Tax=Blastochloris viridis TaxID=1079 RepID=A0A0H5BNN8_BLAVI|nr:thiamine phosphate synthase [Blastochloris viridis]ALK08731.1 Thiamine-phosphate synthase [Blastochloris viridis]BAR97973.1 thiamin-phosphate pyrophosphorylase [Blastochloris viridis]CUU41392.1 Thiamine-phosphate synthase [Blastochloris viridis]